MSVPTGSKLGSLLGHNRDSDPALEELTVQGEEMDVLIAGYHRAGWAVLLEHIALGDSDAGGDSLSSQGRLHRGGDFLTEP